MLNDDRTYGLSLNQTKQILECRVYFHVGCTDYNTCFLNSLESFIEWCKCDKTS